MAHLRIPQPSVETLIAYCVEWGARTLRAKVSVTVWKSEDDHYTEEYDARGLKVGDGDTEGQGDMLFHASPRHNRQ